MNVFIGGHQVITDDDALELALELYLGVDDETGEERAARLDAGRDLLAEDSALFDRVVRLAAEGLEKGSGLFLVLRTPASLGDDGVSELLMAAARGKRR